MAMPAVTLPPGELMYKLICFSVLSASKNNSWATITEARLSVTYMIHSLRNHRVSSNAIFSNPPLTGPFKQIMRSFSKREKMSYALSPRPYICLVLAVLISVHLCINTHSLLNHHWHHLRMRRLWPRANDVATWLCKKRLIKQVNHAVLVLFAMSGLLWYVWHEKVRGRICELCLSAL